MEVKQFSHESLQASVVQRKLPGKSIDAFANCLALIVRTMPLGSLEQVIFRMNALYQRELAGCSVYNRTRCLEICIDKYLTLVMLAKAGICVPRTHVSQTAEAAMEGYEILGQEVVIKPIFGSEGRGILRVHDPDLAWRTFRTLERSQAVIYQQEFIPHPGYDIRVFILDGRVLAAMKRSSQTDWRTNCSRGAVSEVVKLSAAQEERAIRAAHAVQGWAVGVDILQSPSGEEFVLEVNAVPGWRHIAPTCGVDVAKEMLKAIRK